MFRKFKIKGNRPHIRLDEEMTGINPVAADEAFKQCKKRILDVQLASKGFLKYKTNAYVRKNRIDVLEYLDLQKERHGSRTFTVNYAIMPLYIPHDYVITGFGERLGMLICNKDIWWDYADEDIAQISFQNVSEAIDRFVLPWFEKYSDETYLMDKLAKDQKESRRTGIGIPYKNEEWLCTLKEGSNKNEIITESIERLKLPIKLLD